MNLEGAGSQLIHPPRIYSVKNLYHSYPKVNLCWYGCCHNIICHVPMADGNVDFASNSAVALFVTAVKAVSMPYIPSRPSA